MVNFHLICFHILILWPLLPSSLKDSSDDPNQRLLIVPIVSRNSRNWCWSWREEDDIDFTLCKHSSNAMTCNAMQCWQGTGEIELKLYDKLIPKWLHIVWSWESVFIESYESLLRQIFRSFRETEQVCMGIFSPETLLQNTILELKIDFSESSVWWLLTCGETFWKID